MEINLIVIRTDKLEELVNFYKRLGLDFQYHKHGNGPMHYSTEIDNIVFEIYPLRKKDNQSYNGLRLGFKVEDLDNLLERFRIDNVKILKEAEQTEWGYCAIIQDSDGRKIELSQKVVKVEN